MMGRLISDSETIRAIAKDAKRVAVLGIKPESRATEPAHYVPRYLLEHGVEVIPVPVYYPEITRILDRDVVRDLKSIEGPIDIVCVFRRSRDIPPHLPDLLAARPKTVWFQLGISNDDVAEELARAGIDVVQDRCMLVEHRAATR
jgi:predicted CoA-binding protein